MMPTSAGGPGYQIPLLRFLHWHLARLPASISPPNEPILLKLAFDGATITSGKRITQELGGFQLLHEGEPLSSIKSPQNCHVWVIYIGGETEEELRKELQSTILVHHTSIQMGMLLTFFSQAVNHLVQSASVIVNGKEWKVKPVLTCDLKALMKMLGLYDVFHPKSHWKCPFCDVSQEYVICALWHTNAFAYLCF